MQLVQNQIVADTAFERSFSEHVYIAPSGIKHATKQDPGREQEKELYQVIGKLITFISTLR